MIRRYKDLRTKRRARIRAKIKGTEKRPRLSVFRSNRAIYAQLIDDVRGRTIVSASTKEIEVKNKEDGKDKNEGKINETRTVGNLLAKKAIKKGIKTSVFDRGGYKFHGRIKALAEGAREGGLRF